MSYWVTSTMSDRSQCSSWNSNERRWRTILMKKKKTLSIIKPGHWLSANISYWFLFQCFTLIIMFLEAMTILVRQSSHFRVTRALRPIFLIDTKYCGAVRRFIRQILLTLPPILDMLGLLFFLIIVYTVLGYYLFSEMNRNFSTLQDSFVSLFVLLTTAKWVDNPR